MTSHRLADHFVGVGVKTLSEVDANPRSSNQHEIGTTRQMRSEFLGEEDNRRFNTRYLWLGDEDDGIVHEGWATHYDARRNRPDRAAEWRLYYPSNPVTEAMRAGDTLHLAEDRMGELWFIVTPAGSTGERQLSVLFDAGPAQGSFLTRHYGSGSPEIGFAERLILETLGIATAAADTDRLDSIIADFGNSFPTTARFSARARETLPDINPKSDPDAALLAWLQHEEAMFRRLEHLIVGERLREGFVTPEGPDVDGFLGYAQPVLNRRKARMGYSLEHHVSAVLDAHSIRYARQAITENNHKPDFLFPDWETYHTAPSGDPRLTMLGAKSSCKDRWRQVLPEADRIPEKHLLTLEPGISGQQTAQMKSHSVRLVVPRPIQATYTPDQRDWLMSLAAFIETVLRKQRSR